MYMGNLVIPHIGGCHSTGDRSYAEWIFLPVIVIPGKPSRSCSEVGGRQHRSSACAKALGLVLVASAPGAERKPEGVNEEDCGGGWHCSMGPEGIGLIWDVGMQWPPKKPPEQLRQGSGRAVGALAEGGSSEHRCSGPEVLLGEPHAYMASHSLSALRHPDSGEHPIQARILLCR